MIRVFYKNDTFVNVDNDHDAQGFLNAGFTELTLEEIANTGMVGYEHTVCSENTKFENGQIVFTLPQPPSQEEIVKSRITEIQSAVQNLLDSKAQEKNYDNGFAIASYANSTDTIFHEEATRFIAWRDTCWRECYNILAQFQNGEIEMPTVEYVLERLPTLDWEQ